MKKNLQISILLDFYKEMLTEKQTDAIDLYYNQDLSLSEISEHLNITRQGVRDSIKRGEKLLLELEEKLRLVGRFRHIQDKIDKIDHIIQETEVLNEQKLHSGELASIVKKFKVYISDINEKV